MAAANGETTRRTRPAGRSRRSAMWSSTRRDIPQRGTQPAEQLLAGIGRRNAASGARQEPHADAFFKAAYRMAQR